MALPKQPKHKKSAISTVTPKRRKPLDNFEKMRSERLLSISAEELNKLNQKQLFSATKRAYDLASKRVKNIQKKHMYSPAFSTYFNNEMPSAPSSSSKVSQLRHEFVKLHQFLSAKTSTVKGIEELKRNEARRIFGDESQIMSDEQRRRFWTAYEEFMNQNPDYLWGQLYKEVMQSLGELNFWKRRDFNAQDLKDLLNKVGPSDRVYSDSTTGEGYNGTSANVLAGRWYD